MTQDKISDKKKIKDQPPTKVVIRRLPPSLKEADLLEQLSPLPSYDYFYYMKADFSLGPNAFSRAYFNFQNYEDIANFRDKFDNYIFVDIKGNEYPAIVEFSSFQKVPKKKARKLDSKKGTIEQDSDYLKFLQSLETPDSEVVVPIETYLEELEAKERELKANKGLKKVTTPLIEYLKKKREDKKNAVLRARDERKKRELDRKRLRDEDRRRRKERERERDLQKQRDRNKERSSQDSKDKPYKDTPKDESSSIKLLKNPEREKDPEKPEIAEKESPQKGRDDRTKLRFSKENRVKTRHEEKRGKEKTGTASGGSEYDRPRSARDRPDSGRARSVRDERPSPREDRSKSDRWSERDDHHGGKDRGSRPRSYREERAKNSRDKDDYRDEKLKGSSKDDKRKDNGRKDSGKVDKIPVKSDSSEAPNRSDDLKLDRPDKGSVKLDRDRNKSDAKGGDWGQRSRGTSNASPRPDKESVSDSKDISSVEKLTHSESDSKLDDKKKKRKERPERAIYDPRKARERRNQGPKSAGPSTEGASDSTNQNEDDKAMDKNTEK